jgi:hypothetical protein
MIAGPKVGSFQTLFEERDMKSKILNLAILIWLTGCSAGIVLLALGVKIFDEPTEMTFVRPEEGPDFMPLARTIVAGRDKSIPWDEVAAVWRYETPVEVVILAKHKKLIYPLIIYVKRYNTGWLPTYVQTGKYQDEGYSVNPLYALTIVEGD